MASPEVPSADEEPTPARIEAFSDGVFSIIITLLALDLRVPRDGAHRSAPLVDVLLEQWPMYLAFIASFLQVGVVWANHHAMFHYIRRTDHRMLVYNLLLLMAVAVLPFTSALLAEHVRGSRSDLRVAAVVYSGMLGICGVFFNAVWQHALDAGLVKPQADPHRLYALRRHWLLIPVFYAIALVFALLSPRVSLGIYLLLLFYYALPGPIVIRRLTAHRRMLAHRAGAGPPHAQSNRYF
ncbi:MAG TPA: TMEM175 family protein [Gemmatimonadaceae bacterium]|nr:TMEM175 family protein [Gemmatimonadaceae bacterium]